MTEPATTMDLWDDAKPKTEVLGKAMNLVCYACNADYHDLEGLPEVGSRQGILESVNFLLCDLLHDMRYQEQLENTSHKIIPPNDVHNFCEMTKKMIKNGGRGYVFLSALQISVWW